MRCLALLAALLALPLAAQETLTAPAARAQAALSVAPLSCSSAPLLTCSSNISASPSCLSDQYYVDIYTFNATAGQTITITTTTVTSYQMLITVQASNGTILNSNFGASPVSLTYTFTSSGAYFIGFGYVATFATGTYNLTISCANTSSGCLSSGTLALNSSISGQLTSANGSACLGGNNYSAVYGFNGTKDTPVVITFTSSFAPYVEVEPDGSATGVWKSSTTAGSIVLTYLPSATGPQWVYFTSNTSSPTTGSYTVRLDPLSVDPCRKRSVSH